MSYTTYRQYDISVSRKFRDLILELYPGHGENEFYWRMTQHLLLTGRAEDVPEHGIITPQWLVWAIAEDNSHKRSAESWIQEYAETVGVRILVEDANHDEHKARLLYPEYDKRVTDYLLEELNTPAKDKIDKVFFVTGEPTSRRTIRAERLAEEDYLIDLSRVMDEDHPAQELMDYLRGEHYHQKYLANILPRLREEVNDRFTGKRLAYNLKIISKAEAFCKVYYHTTGRTCRVSPTQLTVLSFSREIRKLAFSDCHTFDLASAHLAIDAKLWGLSKINAFLAAGNKPWGELANCVFR